MTLDGLIQNRRSIRSYEARQVDDETLYAVLEAGRLAPSARNAQTWRFTAVRNAALRTALVEACGGQKMVGEAPTALVVWSSEDRTMACGQSAASVDCSTALSFMMLKAQELGLGTCWLGKFSADEVKRLLELPDGAVVVAVTPLGYPAEAPAARPRKEMREVADIRE